MDISKENIKVFSWHRHGAMKVEKSVDVIRKAVDKGLFSKFGLPKDFLRGKIVVDVGCGGGLKSNAYGLSGAKLVIGIDGSEKALQAAQQCTDYLGLNNVVYRKGNIDDLEKILSDYAGRVDFLVCNQVIHHCSSWRNVIRSFGKIVRAGGHMFVNHLSIGRNFGQYILKNQVTFFLGFTPSGRLWLGRALFGWWDWRYNIRNIEKNSFFADRYAAYYKIIFVGQMMRELKRNSFRIINIDPPIDILESIMRSFKGTRPYFVATVERMARKNQGMRTVFNIIFRIKEFVTLLPRGDAGGGMRGYMCIRQ